MKVLITGTTGMVGKGVLYTCLDDPDVEKVVTISRSSCEVSHPKLEEIIHKDFFDLTAIESQFEGFDACYFCLGVSSVGMSEDQYRHLTYTLTMTFAETLFKLSPQAVFCYVSGAGTDETESARMMWARVKGKTENDLSRMGFKGSYAFRPGFIQPMRGIKSKTNWYQFFYNVLKPFYGLLQRMPKYVTDTDKVGFAMLQVTKHRYHRTIIESNEINELAAEYSQAGK